jgi:hypothetical protein
MRVRICVAITVLALLAPAPAGARQDIFNSVKSGAPLTIRADRAYVLFRAVRKLGINWTKPIFMRVPNALDAGMPNVQDISDKPYSTVDDTEFYLVEVPPGDYVYYGMGVNHVLQTCNCLGTVGFTVAPGRVTDIGTLLYDVASKTSDVPELMAETGLGASVNGGGVLTVTTIRPTSAQTPALPGVDRAIVMPADFKAIGPYPNGGALYINRLAPIAGVLAYDKDGRVLDVKRNVEALPHN